MTNLKLAYFYSMVILGGLCLTSKHLTGLPVYPYRKHLPSQQIVDIPVSRMLEWDISRIEDWIFHAFLMGIMILKSYENSFVYGDLTNPSTQPYTRLYTILCKYLRT